MEQDLNEEWNSRIDDKFMWWHHVTSPWATSTRLNGCYWLFYSVKVCVCMLFSLCGYTVGIPLPNVKDAIIIWPAIKKRINDKLELYNIIVLDPTCTQHVRIKFIDDLYPHNLASCSLSREHVGSTNRHVNKMHYLWCLWAVPKNLKHSFLPISTDLLFLQIV